MPPALTVIEPNPNRARISEPDDVERPLPKVANWMTEKGVGSNVCDDDLHERMNDTLQRIECGDDVAAPVTANTDLSEGHRNADEAAGPQPLLRLSHRARSLVRAGAR